MGTSHPLFVYDGGNKGGERLRRRARRAARKPLARAAAVGVSRPPQAPSV
jgi:hypothetical protein